MKTTVPQHEHRHRLLILAAILLLIGAQTTAIADSTVKRIPPVNVLDAGGKRHELLTLLGEGATLILFWNTPCISCLDKLTEIVAFAEARPEADFRFLMINTDPPRNAKQVKPFLHRYGFDPAVNYLDSNAEAFRKVQGDKAPLLLLLDSTGSILFRTDAYKKSDLATLDELVRSRADEDAQPAPGGSGD